MHPQVALAVILLAICNAVILPIVNVMILYLNRKYYTEKKLHTVYPILYKPTLKKCKSVLMATKQVNGKSQNSNPRNAK